MYSIVITTYECNGKGVSFLKDNIDAVLSQTYRPLQCVISDHSRDSEIETFLQTVDKKDVEFVYTRYHDHYGNPSHNWNNDRGVIRAIEEYFGSSFTETSSFHTTLSREGEKWSIFHDNFCSGLTVCRKY